MSYARPSLQTLIQQSIGDISARSRGSAFIRRSFERVLAHVVAALVHGLHGQLEWLHKQMSPVTCEIEMLLAWGVLLRVPRLSATQAVGPVTFAGTNGVVLPAGRRVLRSDGAEFVVRASGTVSGGSVTVSVEAITPGAAGNLETGTALTLVVPVVGIDSAGLVASPGLKGGRDIEDVEVYRERILDNFRAPPSGGGPGDYVKWAKEATDAGGVPVGVTRAWEFSNRDGVGTVSLAFVIDTRADAIPEAADVDTLQDYIDARRPIDMRGVYVIAPTPKPVDMTIALEVEDDADVDTVRANVVQRLRALFAGTNLETPLAQSVISEAISSAAGEASHEVTSISSLAAGNYELLTLGTITWA